MSTFSFLSFTFTLDGSSMHPSVSSPSLLCAIWAVKGGGVGRQACGACGVWWCLGREGGMKWANLASVGCRQAARARDSLQGAGVRATWAAL